MIEAFQEFADYMQVMLKMATKILYGRAKRSYKVKFDILTFKYFSAKESCLK